MIVNKKKKKKKKKKTLFNTVYKTLHPGNISRFQKLLNHSNI